MHELQLLLITAAALGFIHTALGPDHYLPFIVLSKARNWSQSKTLWLTFISGVGHVLSSVIIGVFGIALGISLTKLEFIESQRGDIAGWLIVVFGLFYTIYGSYKFLKNGGHTHLPKFIVPQKVKEHNHIAENKDNTKLTPWILFLIFIFGPCEVLIPLLIFPAAEFNTWGIILVSIVFGATTIFTMLSIVLISYQGLSFIKLRNRNKYMHLVAGIVILISGIGITLLGW